MFQRNRYMCDDNYILECQISLLLSVCYIFSNYYLRRLLPNAITCMTNLGCPKLEDDLTAYRVPKLRAMLLVCDNKQRGSFIKDSIYIYIYIYYKRSMRILY